MTVQYKYFVNMVDIFHIFTGIQQSCALWAFTFYFLTIKNAIRHHSKCELS